MRRFACLGSRWFSSFSGWKAACESNSRSRLRGWSVSPEAGREVDSGGRDCEMQSGVSHQSRAVWLWMEGREWGLPWRCSPGSGAHCRGYKALVTSQGWEGAVQGAETIRLHPSSGIFFFNLLLLFFWLHRVACGILGMELVPPAVEAQSLNHRTAR